MIGANGSGKSTLLRLLNALAVADRGSVTLELSTGEVLDPARRHRESRTVVGFVFSDPDAQIVMPTPAEDVALSLRRLRLSVADRNARVVAVLRDAGLAERGDVPAFALSSGQKQLLAIAAVLATDPGLVVLDEPTTLLDLRNSRAIEERIAGLAVPVVMASHDLDLVARTCERVLVIDRGRLAVDDDAGNAIRAYRRLAEVP